MFGMWAQHADSFLLGLVLVTGVLFAIPLFAVPLTWAKFMRWDIPAETDLVVYFGRCLGAFVCIVELLCLRAALSGVGLLLAFEVILSVCVFMIVVHVYGAMKKIQPITETLEIIMWVAMLLGALAFWPGSS